MASRKPSETASPARKAREDGARDPEALATKPARSRAKVKITFHVTVPNSTARIGRPVHLAGNLNQVNAKTADWDPATHPMKKVDDTHYSLTLSVPAGAVIEYKYCLGMWEHVERDPNCAELPNRAVTAAGDREVTDVVARWRNIDPCGS